MWRWQVYKVYYLKCGDDKYIRYIMATPNLYLGLQVSSALNHTIQESVPFNVRFGNLPYFFFQNFEKFSRLVSPPSKFWAYDCLDWSCSFWETWVFISKHDVSNITLSPSLLGHQTKYLQFMETFRITKIALFSPNTTLYSYIWTGNLQSDHKRS